MATSVNAAGKAVKADYVKPDEVSQEDWDKMDDEEKLEAMEEYGEGEGKRASPHKQLAWATLEIKGVTEQHNNKDGEIEIEGVASTPNTDRVGDVMDPMGAQFKLPMPLLYQHNANKPIGWVKWAKPDANGIPFKATIARKGVADFIDEARSLIREKLIRGASIGFRELKGIPVNKDNPEYGGRHYQKWEWMELSCVTIPANVDASIHTIKSYDKQDSSAVPGAKDKSMGVVRLADAPTAVGQKTVSPTIGDRNMNVAQQVSAYESKRSASVARMTEVMELSEKEGRSLNETEVEEYDQLKGEVEACNSHIKRLKEHEQFLLQTAQPVRAQDNGGGGATAQDNRGGQGSGEDFIVRPNSNLPKGMEFTRYCIALAAARGVRADAIEIAKQRWGNSTPGVEAALKGSLTKTAVTAGTTTDATWAGPLVPLQPMASEFVEFLYPLTILGQIGMGAFRGVPFNISVPRQTAGSASSKWVGQGAAKPLSKLAFDTISLKFAKISTIIVLTEELVRFSTPSAEMLCRNDLAEAIAQYMDVQFINPSVTAVSNISPASVTNGATLVNASGTSVDSVTTDVAAVFNEFTSNNVPLSGAVWVMNPRTAQAIGMLRTQLGQFAFPDINVNGGTFFGFKVVTSNNVPISSVSGNETIAVLLRPAEILVADDGAINVDTSREASLEMDDLPSGGATSLVSLYQNNLMAIRAERYINWLPRRAHAVAVWDGLLL